MGDVELHAIQQFDQIGPRRRAVGQTRNLNDAIGTDAEYGGFGKTAVGFLRGQRVRDIDAQIAHLRYCALAESQSARDFGLSPREVEVLEWIATGKSNSVIAEILGISPHTVDTIVRRIFSKLDVNDRTTAAIRGLGAGLLRRPKEGPP